MPQDVRAGRDNRWGIVLINIIVEGNVDVIQPAVMPRSLSPKKCGNARWIALHSNQIGDERAFAECIAVAQLDVSAKK